MSSAFYNTSTPANYVETEAPPVDPTIANANQSASGANLYHTWWGAAIDVATFGLWNPDAASTGGSSAGSSSSQGGGIFGSLGSAVSKPIDSLGGVVDKTTTGIADDLKASIAPLAIVTAGLLITSVAVIYVVHAAKS